MVSLTPVEGSNHVVTTFADIESIHTYLVAFVISDFSYVEDTTGSVPHRVYARPQLIADGQAKLAIENSAKVLEAFEDYLSTPYALVKMDQVAVPDFAAG